ncbi:hypothetical protein NB694_004063 [Pantoea ananatis]|nr:hypothetical protein [Pantoea ananatis]MCW0314263.1 hypothetical protein [Pantoea ananatis]
MHSETLPVVRKSLFRARVRQLSWIAAIAFCLLFWGGMLALMV